MFHEGKIKILDFGLCKQIDSEHSNISLTNPGMGTYWYLAPETFYENHPMITSKVDVWATGIIYYELLYGQKPFGHNMSQQNIVKNKIILNASTVNFPEDSNLEISESAKNFIRECLMYDPNDRLNPEQAFNHEYFSDIDMFE